MRRFLLLLAMLLIPIAVFAQEPMPPSSGSVQLHDLLYGTAAPTSIKLKDMSAGDWRRVTVGGGGDMGGFMGMIMSMFGGGDSNTYYTKGQTVTLGGETYIVAYHRPSSRQPNFLTLMMSGMAGGAGGAGKEPPFPKPEKLTMDSAFSLSLLNLRTAGNLNDIRPVDVQQEIKDSEQQEMLFEGTKSKAEASSSDSNLKQLGTAVMMYVQDYDEVFPPIKSAAQVKPLLYPYVKNEATFVHPTTKQPYEFNPQLSKKKLAALTAPAETALAWEAAPAPDNTRGICFSDGHVKRLPEDEWQRMKAAKKIP